MKNNNKLDANFYALDIAGTSIYCLYVDEADNISIETMTVDAINHINGECYLSATNRRKIAECQGTPQFMNSPFDICYLSDLDTWLPGVACCYTSGRDAYDAVEASQTMICSVFYSTDLEKIKKAISSL